MKTKHVFFGFLVLGAGLSSCSGISHVTDDDVYVLKAPVLPAEGEISDESSYQNYRYQRDRGDYDVRYGNCFGIWSPSYMPYGYYNNGYSAFNNPYYNPWGGFGYPIGSANGITIYYGYGYGYGNYMNYGSGYGWGTYYGYPYGYGNNYYGSYGNTYGNGKYGNGQVYTSSNVHKAPRNVIGGVNNSRRSSAPGMKGMSVKPGTNTHTASRSGYQASARKTGEPSIATGRTSGKSKPIEAGRGLSKNEQTIHTSGSSASGRRPSNTTHEVNHGVSRTSPSRTIESGSPSRTPNFESGGGNKGSGGVSRPSTTPSTPAPAGRRGG